MGEYEEWAKRKAVEDEARQRLQAQKDAAGRQSFLAAREQDRLGRKSHFENVLIPIAGKIEAIFGEALRSHFSVAKQHKIYQYHQTYSGEYPSGSYIAVIGMWGEKLEPTQEEKDLINGKRRLFKPKQILDRDYNSINCAVYFDYVDAFNGGKRITIQQFQQDPRVIFEHIYNRMKSPQHEYETWILQNDGGYRTATAISDQQRMDSMG